MTMFSAVLLSTRKRPLRAYFVGSAPLLAGGHAPGSYPGALYHQYGRTRQPYLATAM